MAKPTKHGDKWRIRWLDARGKRQSTVFDEYKRAQTELSRRQVEVEEIRRGTRHAPPPEKTFSDLCDYWLANRTPRKRSCKDDKSLIEKHLRPAFGPMCLLDIGSEDVDAYVNQKIDDEELSEKYVANQVTLLGTMLRAATTFKVPWLTSVPKFRKPKVALFSRDYQWLRSDDDSTARLVRERLPTGCMNKRNALGNPRVAVAYLRASKDEQRLSQRILASAEAQAAKKADTVLDSIELFVELEGTR